MILDPVTRDFDRLCRRTPGLVTALQDHLDADEMLRGQVGDVLCRPLFVASRELADFTRQVDRLLALVTSLPDRLFDGDLHRFCAAIAVPGPEAALMRRLDAAAAMPYGRVDAYHDGTSFTVLEVNMSSEVGGIEYGGSIPRTLLGYPPFAAFASEHRLNYTDSAAIVAQQIQRTGKGVTGGRDPVVVLLEAPGGIEANGAAWRDVSGRLRAEGLECHLGELDAARLAGGRLHVDGRRVDVVFRCFDADQVAAAGGEELLAPLHAAERAGRLLVWTPLESELFGNKRCMALLSDPRYRSAFDDTERAVIDAVLPWTRSLAQAPLQLRRLLDHCREHRGELILKPASGSGGSGVMAGWETGEREWAGLLADRAGTAHVVQRRVVPRAEPVFDPASGVAADWRAVWGMFHTPDGYAGGYARALPVGRSAVINLCRDAGTRNTGFFHVEDGEEGAPCPTP